MNKEKKLTVVIIVLVIVLLGCVGFICYDKLISNNNDVEVKVDDEEKEDRELTFDELNALKAKIKTYNSSISKYYPINDLSVIDNNTLFSLGLSESRNSLNQQEYDATLMDETIKKYFGDELKIKHENYLCPVEGSILYNYDEANHKYTFNTEGIHGHGGSISGFLPDIDTKVLDGKYEDGFYYVNAKVLYSNSCGDTCGGVNSYYDKYSGGNKVADVDYQYEVTEEQKETFREKLPITTYKFKEKNNNLVLVSVTVE